MHPFECVQFADYIYDSILHEQRMKTNDVEEMSM